MSIWRCALVCLALTACGGAGGPGLVANPGASNAAPTPTAGPTPGPTPTPTAGVAMIGNCRVFPSDNPWNQDVSAFPVDPNSANYLASMNAGSKNLHPDFGSNPTYGIPYITVPGLQPFLPVVFNPFGAESDPGPYPIPTNAPIEGGSGSTGDRHTLAVDLGNCKLYELYDAFPATASWNAGSGAIFDFSSNALRPDYWTSADAAGLPILAGLARYDETVQTQGIFHALRFTVHQTQTGFIHPATHFASTSSNLNLPPMGLRVRLKASYDISHFTGASFVILTALKKYGMFVADNGSDWFISGSTDGRWNDADLNQLKTVPASAFEVVKTGTIIH